jgi:hypothetical protein
VVVFSAKLTNDYRICIEGAESEASAGDAGCQILTHRQRVRHIINDDEDCVLITIKKNYKRIYILSILFGEAASSICKYDIFNHLIVIPTVFHAIHCCVWSDALKEVNVTLQHDVHAHCLCKGDKGHGYMYHCGNAMYESTASTLLQVTTKLYFITPPSK